MSKKIILLIVGLTLLLIVIFYQLNVKKESEVFDLFEVVRGNVYQEVSEVGQLKKGEEINLAFKTSGRIEKIYVNVGDEIKKWTTLAKMDTKGLEIQLQQAKSDLAIYQAKLDKLLVGASPEEIQKVETAVSNAQVSLGNTQQNLIDVRAESEEDLNAAYEDALNVLDGSYLKIYNAFLVVDSVQETYFYYYDQESIKVRENEEIIKTASDESKSYLDTAQGDPSHENIDLAISEIKELLSQVSSALIIIRDMCEEPSYSSEVSSTNKTSLDTQRTNINTALTNIANSQQTISSTKLTNESNINTAQTTVSTAEGSLTAAEDELALTTASPQKADVDLYEAQVTKAQSQVEYLENQIKESYLYAPVDGQVIEIKKRVGEMVSSVNEIIVFSPADPFQIEVDIYEEDIIKISIDNPVDISLVAFPDKIFEGRIISIDPTEKLVEGVVYYQVKISLEELPDEVKPGMTADLIIKTAFRENVLIIPEDAIQEKDDKTIVEILKDNVVEEKEVEVGLEGSDDMVEVISGVLEGEKVILK